MFVWVAAAEFKCSPEKMDITKTSDRQFEIGIDQFLAGQTLACNEVVFSISKKRELEICSYSEFFPENTTEEMMREKIMRAERVLAAVAARSERFRDAIAKLSKRHLFCYDYGTAAVAIAVVENGTLTWHDKRIRLANKPSERTR